MRCCTLSIRLRPKETEVMFSDLSWKLCFGFAASIAKQQWPQVAIANKLAQQLTRLEQEFGMTPSARSRIQVSNPEPARPSPPRSRGSFRRTCGWRGNQRQFAPMPGARPKLPILNAVGVVAQDLRTGIGCVVAVGDRQVEDVGCARIVCRVCSTRKLRRPSESHAPSSRPLSMARWHQLARQA